MMMRYRGHDRKSLPADIPEGGRIVSVNAGAFVGSLVMAVALLVAACDKERCEPAPQTAMAPDQSADLRKAAENSVRVSASNPDSVRFRGVEVWPQAVKNQFAVCGQANVFGPTSNTYVLFVVVVTRNDLGDDPARTFKAEARVGSTITEATKVYVDTLVRCYESGGPQNIMRGTATPVPPMPSETNTVLSSTTPASTGDPTAPAPAAQAQPSAMVQAPPTPTQASGTVVMRQNGNIRSAPQGEVIRVEPQGKELRVFGEAPGGWLQIGDTEANGWVHSSLVQRR
jgi:Bacterial SH3 domain